MGQRADASAVRHGAPHASVEGCWHVANAGLIAQIEDTGAVVEDGQVFVNRTVAADGKSRAVLGGKSTPAKVLADIADNLVSIHGQADQLRLRSPEAQRLTLDRFAKAQLASPMAAYGKAYAAWRTLTRQLEDLKVNAVARAREYRELQAFMEEFDELEPEAGEIEALEESIDLLSHMDTLREGVSEALNLLAPDDYESMPAEAQLRQVAKALASLSEHDAKLDPLVEQAKEAVTLLDCLTSDLETYRAGLDEDSLEQLYQAQERLTALKAFVKRHRAGLDDLLERAEQAAERLKELDPEANSVEALEEAVRESYEALCKQGAKITAARTAAARKLEKAVNKELAGLAMSGAALSVELMPAKPSSTGLDDIALMLTMPGSPTPRPMAKAASGGELSRIMLALEVVLADPDETPTFIFDEVDAGVGGATAIEIGKRLARLAQDAQVIVVSHLPQVACWATTHLLVSKATVEGANTTTVKRLTEKQRVREITRMLSGLEGSASGAAHAEELLEMVANHQAD